MNTRAGEPTAALYGFSTLLLKLLRQDQPAGIAFARDLPGPTFRHERYHEYKANRPPVPDVLRPQWARLDQLLAALGVPQLKLAGFEADDVLATAARCLAQNGHAVKIVSGDRDLFQTIGPHVRVEFVGARAQKPKTLDVAAIEARYGVAPDQLPTLFALVGEAADNLIGVPGIGVRTASKLVARYGSVAGMLADLDAVTPLKTQQALRDTAERVLMNEELARLRVDLELGADPIVAKITRSALNDVRDLFEQLEFRSLMARLALLNVG